MILRIHRLEPDKKQGPGQHTTLSDSQGKSRRAQESELSHVPLQDSEAPIV